MILMPQSMAVTKHLKTPELIIWAISSAHSSQTKPDRGCVLSSLPSFPSIDPSGFGAWGEAHPTLLPCFPCSHYLGGKPDLSAAEVLDAPADAQNRLFPPPECCWIPAAPNTAG